MMPLKPLTQRFPLLALSAGLILAITVGSSFSTKHLATVTNLHRFETIHLEGHSASATAFFELQREFMDLTVILTDAASNGEVTRAGARLVDGQTFRFVYGGDDEDPISRTVFVFRREGFRVLAHHHPGGTLAGMAMASLSWGER